MRSVRRTWLQIKGAACCAPTCHDDDWMRYFQTFLFDLDGTLVDSVADLATAVNLLRRDLDLPDLDLDTVKSYVGDGATLLVKRSIPEAAFSEQILLRFLGYYEDHLFDRTHPYPGIVPFLDRLDGRRLAVVTNKPHRFAVKLLAGLQLAERFALVLGGDSCPTKKPDAGPVLQALQDMGAAAETAVMIGDHHTDLRAGRAAGIATCFCAWGIGRRDGIAADFTATEPDDLVPIFCGASA